MSDDFEVLTDAAGEPMVVGARYTVYESDCCNKVEFEAGFVEGAPNGWPRFRTVWDNGVVLEGDPLLTRQS